MKYTHKTIRLILLFIFSTFLASCGPSESELRTELQGIEQEMMALKNAAYQHQSAMDQASFDAFLGGFAVGFGAMDGNYELAGAGVGGVADAANRADVAGYSLNQIQERYNTLAKRRNEIVAALR